MKKIKNLVIGGIESKVTVLIAVTIIVMLLAFIGISQYQNSMLSRLSSETNEQQQEAIMEISSSVMEDVVDQSMARTTQLEALYTDEMFHGLKTRVEMLGEYAGRLLSDPEGSLQADCAAPDPAQDGKITAQLIMADGVDASEEKLAARIGAIAGMTDMMVSLFGASEQTNSCFVALPEGAFLVVDDRSASKYDEDGTPVSYDARTRPWYTQAVESEGLIFTDVEVDAFTGDVGIVCAMPVYVDGKLEAVVGSDLFLTAMQDYVQGSEENGGYVCVVNQNGHVVFSPKQEGVFKVTSAAEAADLRQSEDTELAALISDAMEAGTEVRVVTLEDGDYYIAGAPVETVGWALISVFSKEMAATPTAMLQESNAKIQEEAAQTYRSNIRKIRWNTRVVILVLTALLLINSLILGKKIVKPLNAIIEKISKPEGAGTEFKMENSYRTGDEIELLAESFSRLSHKTVQYMDQVKKATAEKERVNVELQLSHDIQVNMLPNIFPAFPERSEFDIYATMIPAKEVGGDFYDFYLVDDTHLAMVIADVSGKGIPAAMFMMASKIIINNISAMGVSDPAKILEAANRQITSNNPAEMFVTVWLGILEISSGKVIAANAGHEYPFIMRHGGQFEMFRDKHDFVVGGLEEIHYHNYELKLDPGDAIFVYTDGVAEANNPEEELFGTKRLNQALNRNPEGSCEELLKNVEAALDEFVENAPQFDDTTMLALRYNGTKDSLKEPTEQ